MGHNVGLDFGTTYSVISRLKNKKYDTNNIIKEYELEACAPCEGASPCQDSVVLKDRAGALLHGPLTRDKIGRKGMTVYKGFKMMLAEENKEVLKSRGYDDDYTPRKIVKEYLDDLLQQYMSNNNVEYIDKIVIGVPEIWFEDKDTVDCRTILKNIVSSFAYIGDVELVSEPAAACAFFVDNYKKKQNKAFKGKILLIDYGGGTLDIALCDVNEKGQCSEVSVKKRCGAGLNEEKFIGKAGMAFIEAIVKLALENLGLTEEQIITNNDFYPCVNSVESALMSKMTEIEKEFRLNKGFLGRDGITKKFYDIYFDGEEYPVTYGMLSKAYDKIIRPVLEDKLNEMIKYLNDNNMKVDKIVPVGGFCNFFLTQDQIEVKLGKFSGDERFSKIIDDRRDCEKAISYGAALISENIIGFKQLSPYHLGFGRGSEKTLIKAYYVFHKGDEIAFDEPVFMHYENGEHVTFSGDSERIPLFVFNSSDDENNKNCTYFGEPTEEYKEKLLLKKLPEGQVYKFGFSLDKSMIITLHKQIVDRENPNKVYSCEKIVLNEMRRMLGGLLENKEVK